MGDVDILRSPDLGRSRLHMGDLMAFLVPGADTAGRFTMIDAKGRIGNEPPPHCHLREDEIFYILSGSAEFFIEGQENSIIGEQGDVVFLPCGKAHTMYFRSEIFHPLIMAVARGDGTVGVDAFFRQISVPAPSLELPDDPDTYAIGDPQQTVDAGTRNGIMMLSPEETKRRLPNYPGFGANLPGRAR